MTPPFLPGQRVVVKGFAPDDPNPLHWSRLVGHYGHVDKLMNDFVVVKIKGSIPGAEAFPGGFELDWAFYPAELEHAD